jgi:hypothetical protein
LGEGWGNLERFACLPFSLALSMPIQEYSEIICFFGKKYVKKMMECQARIAGEESQGNRGGSTCILI